MALDTSSSPADFSLQLRAWLDQHAAVDAAMRAARDHVQYDELLVKRNGIVQELVEILRVLRDAIALAIAELGQLEDLVRVVQSPDVEDQLRLAASRLTGLQFAESLFRIPAVPAFAGERADPMGDEAADELQEEPIVPPPAPPVDPPPLVLVPAVPPAAGGFGLGDLLSWSFWEGLFGDLATVIFSVGTTLPGQINSAWNNLASWDDAIWRFMQTIPDTTKDLVADEVERITRSVVGGAESAIAFVFEPFVQSFQDFQTGVDQITSRDWWVETLAEGLQPFVKVLAGALSFTFEVLEETARPHLKPVIDIFAPVWDDLPPEIVNVIDIRNPTGQWQAILFGSVLGTLGGAFLAAPIKAWAAPVQWAANVRFRPRLLGQEEMATATWRFPERREDWAAEAARLGISDKRWVDFVSLQRPLMFPTQIRDAMFRGALDAPGARRHLEEIGYFPNDIDPLMATFPVLPQMQDVIRFGVRDVYRPEVVEDFQLDDFFPPPIVADAARIGLAKEEVLKFWRAHWELPSIQQAYRMHQRTTEDPIEGFSEPVQLPGGQTVYRIISRDRILELLRIADVMPFWRDPQLRVAFRPIPRRGIARLYRTGALDEAAVYRAYLDVGFNERNAGIQTEFVQLLEAERTFDQLETILGGQAQDGVLSAEDAIAELDTFVVPERVKLGAERRVNARVSGQRLGDRVAAWRQALRFERVPESDFRAELAELGVRPEVIEHWVETEHVRAGLDFLPFQEAEVRAAGRGVPVRRFREGLTDRQEFRDELVMLGYKDTDVARFEVQALLEQDANIRLDTLAAYRAGLRTGRLTEPQFRARASQLGVEPRQVDVYVETDQLRRKLEDPTDEEKELRATGRGTVLARYREGWTSRDEFAGEMLSLGYTLAEADRYQLQADLAFDLDWKADILRQLGDMFTRGTLEASEYVDRLAVLGMDANRAGTHLARLQVSLLPRRRVEPAVEPLPRYRTAAGRAQVRLAVEQFRSQEISQAELEGQLRNLEMPEDLVQATVELEAFRLEQRLAIPDPPGVPEYLTDDGKVRMRTLREAFRGGLFDVGAYQTGLEELEVGPDLVDALVDFESTRLAARRREEPIERVPRYQTTAGRRQVQLSLEQFRSQAITPAALLSQLRNLEMPEDLVQANADLEQFRLDQRIAVPEVATIPFYLTDEGKIRLRTAREVFRQIAIPEGELLEAFLDLEVPANIADALTAFEVARKLGD